MASLRNASCVGGPFSFGTMQIQYSLYSRFTSNEPTMKSAPDFSEFVLQMAELTTDRLANDRTKRSSTPAISPAIYAPGTVRSDVNVLGWGAWVAMDVDNASDFLPPVRVEDTKAMLDQLGLCYLLYGSTKSTLAKPRYRVVLPTTREIAKDEYRAVWDALVQTFSNLGPDPACKDASRIYGGPSVWVAAKDGNTAPFNIFEFNIEGREIDVDLLLETYEPPPEDERPPLAAFVPTYAEYTGRVRALKGGTSLTDSPVVSSDAIEAYLNLQKGDHHQGMYSFMCSVIGRAKSKGFEITDDEVAQYCRQLDSICTVHTSKERWSRIGYEIARARRFVG